LVLFCQCKKNNT